MSDVIRLLPDSVANQIAAGEVIQRPASVVKELVENSIDSGAGTIRVIIKDSGKTLIQVADDGCGMSETDARLAFERHATSKISSANDLFSITTKGFRGEALASIAAVAMVELRTRRPEDEAGTLVEINGSKTEKQEPCSCQAGSVFSVKSLFYNIPARRKFLKSDATELRHIINEFQKTALAHPAIKFILIHNDSEIYSLQAGNLRQRIVGLFGKQINQDLISVETETSLVKITGFIGKPENARRTSGEQFFFANNRYMKHPYFHKAVMEAYQNILPPDVLPSYFLFLDVDPGTIDINIHPTKTEIKFEDERSIWQILMASVRESLGKFNIVPSIDFEGEPMVDIPVAGIGNSNFRQPEIRVNTSFNPFDSERNEGTRFDPDYRKAQVKGWEDLYNAPVETGSVFGNDEPAEPSRKFMQVKNKYIVCPVKSGIMIIDQRRAHERVLYEKYLSMSVSGKHITQGTMFPERIVFSPSELAVYSEISAELEALGFDIRKESADSLTLYGYPGDTTGDPRSILSNLITLYGKGEADSAKSVKERVCSSMASSAAIDYGRQLTREEMENLFDLLFACNAPNYSPSGKPVVTIITSEDIDKKFK